jgi:glycosyltransferase EpsJ
MNPKEKIQEIKNIITSENVRESLKIAKPNSLVMKLMLIPIKLKFTFLTYLEGTFISKVKSGNVKLFAKLKANR